MKVLYVNIHFGTRCTFDALAEHLNWDVVHVSPNHNYEMSDDLADEIWLKYYKKIILDEEIDLIIIGDITITCGYPILKHLNELDKKINVILQVTNFFYFGNDKNKQITDNFRNLVNDNPRVKIIYVDPFIYKTLQDWNINASHMKYIPLFGNVTNKTNKCYLCPKLENSDEAQLYIKDSKVVNILNPFYYIRVNPYPITSDLGWTEAAPLNHPFCLYNKVIDDWNNIHKDEKDQLKIDYISKNGHGGPWGVKDYFAIVFIPYHYSTISLIEYLSLGIKVIIPSSVPVFSNGQYLDGALMDPYHGPFAHLITRFKTSSHLRQILLDINNLTLEQKATEKELQIKFMDHYNNSVCNEWARFVSFNTAFHSIVPVTSTTSASSIPQNLSNLLPYEKYLLKHKTAMDNCRLEFLPKKSRYCTFKAVLDYLYTIEKPIIVELGTSRCYGKAFNKDTNTWNYNDYENWDHGAGVFTLIIAEALNEMNKDFEIHTIDPNLDAINISFNMTRYVKNNTKIQFHMTTSTIFLNHLIQSKQKAHIIYMDHAESNDPWTQDLHLYDAKLIVENNLLHDNGLILIDDMAESNPKGKLSIPYLLENGFETVIDEYQVLLKKNNSM